MPAKILFLVGLCFLCRAGQSQTLPSDSTLARVLQSDVLLSLLIDSAVKNSAEIRHARNNVAVMEQNMQSAKKSILNSVNLSSSYGYGNSGILSMEKDPTGNPLASLNTVRTSRYNIGVSVLLPLGGFLSRKNAVRTAELQIQMAEDEKENAALFVKQQVIKYYQDLKLAHALLMTTARMKQNAFLSANMAHKSFQDGQTPLDQYTKTQNEYNQTAMEYEMQVNKFQTGFLILEAYTGVQLARLIGRIKP